jgi:hypothetical protein
MDNATAASFPVLILLPLQFACSDAGGFRMKSAVDYRAIYSNGASAASAMLDLESDPTQGRAAGQMKSAQAAGLWPFL